MLAAMPLAKVQALLICCVATAPLSVACTETPYVFFSDASGGACSDGACDCADGACGAGGAGGAAPSERCESARAPSIVLERLELAVSGLCVAEGPYAPLGGDPSYTTVLSRCEPSVLQWWAIGDLDDGGTEVRNEAVDFNLDVRFAASDDGTPLVLYTPHQLYNQRFNVLDGEDDTFKLAPLHAPGKCATERDGTLLLFPCVDGLNDQSFRATPCR